MYTKIKITGDLVVKTGMHIGGSKYIGDRSGRFSCD